MDRETYEKQKPYAGEKRSSMLRRCVGHDYTARQTYLITMVAEGRRPLFGQVVGDCKATAGTEAAPRLLPTELGRRVEQEWWNCGLHHPEMKMLAFQLMPDHLHGILFVTTKMEKPLGLALRGFKQSCNRHYRELILGQPASPPVSVPSVALPTQQTQPAHPASRSRRGEDRTHGLLFARGYNDRILLRAGQLDVWRNYLRDNPRRLLMKRLHPDLFRVRFGLTVGTQTYAALGNRFLLSKPVKLQVQCSRRLTAAEIEQQTAHFLAQARQGAVLVSPAISPGEKAVMRAALNAHLPLIYIEENGLTPYTRPGGEFFEACAHGHLLILAPWEHHNEHILITRDKCLALNQMAKQLCE